VIVHVIQCKGSADNLIIDIQLALCNGRDLSSAAAQTSALDRRKHALFRPRMTDGVWLDSAGAFETATISVVDLAGTVPGVFSNVTRGR
jgi:hypothetical protein